MRHYFGYMLSFFSGNYAFFGKCWISFKIGHLLKMGHFIENMALFWKWGNFSFFLSVFSFSCFVSDFFPLVLTPADLWYHAWLTRYPEPHGGEGAEEGLVFKFVYIKMDIFKETLWKIKEPGEVFHFLLLMCENLATCNQQGDKRSSSSSELLAVEDATNPSKSFSVQNSSFKMKSWYFLYVPQRRCVYFKVWVWKLTWSSKIPKS